MVVDPSEREIEELLRRSRPEPSAAWMAHEKRRLLPERAPSLWRRPAVRAGSALATGFAALAIVFSLAGVGPLGGGGDAVKARPRCHSVATVAPQRTPYLVTDRKGRPHIRYRTGRAPHTTTRCP
jgi:hypothetical protein